MVVTTRKQSAALQAAADQAYQDLTMDLYVLVFSHFEPPAATILARCSMVNHSFAEAVEGALRLRTLDQPAELPEGFSSWLQKLLFDERRRELHTPKLEIGRTHAAAVHAGRVFIWGTEYVSFAGRESIGMLGMGMRNQNGHVYEGDIREPTPLPNVTHAVSVSCGREHTLVLSGDGRVYALGNGEWGQCGTAKGRARYDRFPSSVEPAYLRGKDVITDTGTFGKLKGGYWPIDTLYSIEDDIPFAHCAECVGCMNPPMQISCVKMSDNYKPDEGGHPDGPFGMLPPAFVVPVPRLIFTQDLKVLQVSAGDLHSLLLCEDQHVYAFGCAYDGRLGIGDLAFECAECDDEDNGGDEGSGGAGAGGSGGDPEAGPTPKVPVHRFEPVRVELGALSGDVRVVDISAGPDHSLAVRADGRVASWGSGFLGDCTVARTSGIPVLVSEVTERIRQASAGWAHSLLVGVEGSVFSFGYGNGGCLGHGTNEGPQPMPIKITAGLEGVMARTAAAGGTHSLVLDAEGRVFEFGVEATSRLDWSDDDDEEEEENEGGDQAAVAPRGLPTLIEDRGRFGWTDRHGQAILKGLRATDIAAGAGTSAMRSLNGLVSTGGSWTDTSAVEFESPAWPGAEQLKMIEAVAEKDELEVPLEMGGCIIS